MDEIKDEDPLLDTDEDDDDYVVDEEGDDGEDDDDYVPDGGPSIFLSSPLCLV